METAVEWLEKNLKMWLDNEDAFNDFKNFINKAKYKEKRQIINTYDSEWVESIGNGEDYYNQTFNSKKH